MPADMVALLDGPLSIRPSALRPFLAWVAEGSVPITALAPRSESKARGTNVTNGRAVIAVRGPISRRPTALSFLCGGASTEDIAAQLREAMADSAVEDVVLDFDSPGGTIDGVPELADAIHKASAKKPITAFVDTMAASAAYWLASQATEIVMTASSEVGSIGVYAMHVDYSESMKLAGVKPTFIQYGKNKTELSGTAPLTDEARAYLQTQIDEYGAMFTRDVARGRRVSVEMVRGETWGQGRVLTASEALKHGLADRIGDAASIGMRRSAPPISQARADSDRAHSEWLRLQHNRRGGRTALAGSR